MLLLSQVRSFTTEVSFVDVTYPSPEKKSSPISLSAFTLLT